METPNTNSSSTGTPVSAESTATPSGGNSTSSSSKGNSISKPKTSPQGKGRRKADPSKKIENPNSLQVTNTKRRHGLFSKAASFCEKFKAAEVAVVTFTPGGKPEAFGSPSVDAVIDRYLNATARVSSHQRNTIDHGSASSSGIVGEFWWQDPIDGMSPKEAESYRKGLQGLRENVVKKIEEIRDERRKKHTVFGVCLLDTQ